MEEGRRVMSVDRRELARLRPVWDFAPLEGVGPLRFGISVDEAASALPEAVELRRFQAEPFSPQVVGVQLAFRPGEPAVYEYFDGSGRLFCVAVDAVFGPHVTLDGVELVGGMKFPLGGGQLILRPPGSGLGGSAVVLRAG